MERRLITHIIVHPGTPADGHLQELFFMTRNKKGKYFFLGGNNPFTDDYIERHSSKNMVALPGEVKHAKKRKLWFNSRGEVFYADRLPPEKDPNKTLIFESPRLLELCR